LKKRKVTIFISVSALIIIIVALCLWQTGVIGLWTKGIWYVANNTNNYSCTCETIVKKYTIDVDLSNLDINKGKILYNDGKCKITVDWVDNTGAIHTGGYRIGFRAYGIASINGAELISAVKHICVEDKVFSSDLVAKMTADYNNHDYNSGIFGVGPGYNDGDGFFFYIFPNDAYKSGNVELSRKPYTQMADKRCQAGSVGDKDSAGKGGGMRGTVAP
jgi:hypothetical protein